MVAGRVGAHGRGVDVNSFYAPTTAATAEAPRSLSDEALLGRDGATSLLAVAVLELVGTTVVALSAGRPGSFELAVAYGLAAAFAGLYAWARTSPYPACFAGLALYITMHLLAAVAEPASLAQGLMIKLVVVCVLVRSIHSIASHRAHDR